MCVNAVNLRICKFEATSSVDVASGREWRATAIVEEVAIATAEETALSLKATVSGHSKARTLDNRARNFTQNSDLYKMNFVQQLKLQDHPERLHFALNFLVRMLMDEYWSSHILWIDEAHFHLDGAVNAQKWRIWGSYGESSCLEATTVTHL